MGMACPTLYPRDPFAEAHRMARETFDQWFETLRPLFEQETPPTLPELSQTMTRIRGGLMGGILEGIAEQLYQRYRNQAEADCPRCGQRWACKRMDEKKFVTLQGPMTLERPYFYCTSCSLGFHPMDEAFELAREVQQYDVQQSLTKMSAHMPHQMAAHLLSEMTGVSVSAHASHSTLNRVAEAATLETVLPDPGSLEKKIEKVKTSSRDRPVLVASIDGAHVPIRPKAPRKQKRGEGHWREAKGFRMYLVGEDGRIVHLMSWHQIKEDVEDFREDFLKAAALIPQSKVRIALIADGAGWIWKTFQQAFPEGTQVLDYYHCAEHVNRVAKTHFGETLEGQQWAEATLSRLCLDQSGRVIGGLKRMDPVSKEDEEKIEKLIQYLTNNRERFNYTQCKEEGMPIGSGGIESANKSVCHTRLKRPGAWWIKENGNQMLRLRCALYNDTFEKVFRNYVALKYKNS